MARTIIVSNRLPVNVSKDKAGNLNYQPSAGGLATGLSSVYQEGDNLWIGWPGMYFTEEGKKKEAIRALSEQHMSPVFLTEEEIKLYYEGFSNETLWPTFHYFNQNALYRKSYWKSYEKVNQKFCDELLTHLNPGDKVWVHDYQLMLVPRMIRDVQPDVSVGFFLHIPFPSFEVFRLLPWRRELLDGVLGADLVGFHTYDDMRHFLSAVSRICYISNHHGEIQKDRRFVVTDSFPIGIDYDKYANQAAHPDTISKEVEYRTSLGQQKLVLSIDRLDYSKGIPARLQIFDLFLEKYPQYQDKVSLLMVVVPSRDQVEKYKDLKEQVDTLVGRINGKYGTVNWTPIHYFYRSFPLEDLSAFYRMADVAMVTPMRDGMNLVCKEFVASKLDQKGVLILSEMAGASKELSDALIVNPNDKHQVRDALYKALTMDEAEQKKHMAVMQETLKKYNIHHWVNMFLSRLDQITLKRDELATKVLDGATISEIKKAYAKAKNRMLFLDYDGTLMPFDNDPKAVKPDKELKELLKNLSSDTNNNVVIISGRDKTTLQNWLGHEKLDFIAEHGVWLKEQKGDWYMAEGLDSTWKAEIHPIFEMYVNKTPGSFIEEKDYSLVWHYRKVETGLGELRAREIISHLKYLAVNMNLQVLEGNKVVEIKNIEVNKGKAASRWVQKGKPDFIMAIGDDWTDEDTFKAMPEEAYNIKVGDVHSAANYSVKDHTFVRSLLSELIKN
ncbi:MAG: bifunctional alpha,alpha-trehalose-phosphate synthase (UDP-forming)/trehalose-phosphatase [Fulvivirga sp.]